MQYAYDRQTKQQLSESEANRLTKSSDRTLKQLNPNYEVIY